jgi:peptidyl-prolyl cis-trans isomerase D
MSDPVGKQAVWRQGGPALRLAGIATLVMLVSGCGMLRVVADRWASRGVREEAVAEIGAEVLTVREFRSQMQAALRRRAFPSELAPVVAPQMIDRMITERALAYQAQRVGFRVSDEEVQVVIRSVLPQLFQDGKFVGTEIYARFLAEQNLTIPEFEAIMRKQMLLMKLENLVGEGVVVTPAEIEQEYRRRTEKVKLEYIALSGAGHRSQISVTAEEIRAYFEKQRDTFRIPARRSLALVLIDEGRVGRRVAIPEADLRRAYEAGKDRFRTPERVRVRHILLKTVEKAKEGIPKVEAQAEELLRQIRSGADFADAARRYSQDPGSASRGGDLGWIARGQTVKNFEEAAFSLRPRQLSGVVRTEYGFHILQVLDREEARVQPFAEVKEQLAQERKGQLVLETMQALASQAHAELSKSPHEAERIAARLGLELINAEKVRAGDPLPEIGIDRELEGAVEGLQKGQVTPVLHAGGSKLVVAVVRDVFPAQLAELPEVQSQIRERLASEKLAQVLEQRAREALERAKSLDGDLKRVAQSMGLELRSTQEFGHDGAADGIGPASLVREGFARPVGAVFGPVAVAGQRFVCRVASKVVADMSGLAAQREAISASLKAQKARQRMELFEDSVLTALIGDGKVKRHQQVIERLVASYRG